MLSFWASEAVLGLINRDVWFLCVWHVRSVSAAADLAATVSRACLVRCRALMPNAAAVGSWGFHDVFYCAGGALQASPSAILRLG